MAEPTPKTDNADVTMVDLAKAVSDRAEKEGTTGRLDKAATLNLRELYKREIVQYYAGRDRGYATGFLDGSRLTRRWWVWLSIGAASPVALYLAALVAARSGKVLAAVVRALTE